MRSHAIPIAAAMLAAGAAQAGQAPSRDVQDFIRNAERCEQVATEWDSGLPAKKKKELERALGRYCASAQHQLKTATVKYKDDPEVQKLLTEHSFDSVKYFTK